MTKLTKTLLAVAGIQWLGAAAAQEHRHHHQFPPDVDAFHAVLAPVWHARPGKERSREACAKAGRMETLAQDIRAADGAAVRDTVAALSPTCTKKPTDVDGALHDVHEAFHRIIDAAAK